MASEEAKSISGGKSKQTRRGPAPFASFEDVSDESSSPESKLIFQLPDIQEDCNKSVDPSQSDDTESPTGSHIERGRSLSTPAVQPANSLQTPSTPRIDISRASSSSHHDSRDSSPEMALFTGKEKDQSKLELGFREDGALDLRSSTEELYFMEPNAAATEKEVPRPPSRRSPLIFPSKGDDKPQKHSRKDSQTSDIVLLSISGRTSRLSSIGSQGSAHSNISAQSNISHISIHSHVSAQSRLSVISGISRSPSPHKMLLETSFCGPKPIENEPDVSAGVSEERLLEMAGLPVATTMTVEPTKIRSINSEATKAEIVKPEPTNEIKKEIQIEVYESLDTKHKKIERKAVKTNEETRTEYPKVEIKRDKEKNNQLKVQASHGKGKPSGISTKTSVANDRSREPKKPEVYNSKNRNKNIIRIKLKPDSEEEEDDESERTLTNQETVQKPVTLNLKEQNKKTAQHFSELVNREDIVAVANSNLDRRPSLNKKKLAGPNALTPNASPTPSKKLLRKDHDSRTPSPAGPSVSRKSSFCSLFKSKETITSPDSPSNSMVKRKSVTESSSRSRSKSRDRSTTPTSSGKIKGSVLSLFKTPKKGSSPNSRASSPVVHNAPPKNYVPQPTVIPKNVENLKYYTESKDGIIHIPLHTPPDEHPSTSQGCSKSKNEDFKFDEIITHEESMKKPVASTSNVTTKLTKRTVLPDGSIIIPLHSPTEKETNEIEIEEKKEISVSIETHQANVAPKEETPELVTPVTSSSVPDTPVTTITVTSADEPKRKKEHVLFTTSVGSKEHIFSTQFSITKTPSLTSEHFDMFPPLIDSYQESKEDIRRKEPLLPETHITTVEQQLSLESTPSLPKSVSDMERCFSNEVKEPISSREPEDSKPNGGSPSITDARSIDDIPDSSESEISSEMGALKKNALHEIISQSLGVEDVEKKGLVMTHDSFEDELPYVPTTLPQERSVALPIVPVKERQSTGMRMYPIDRPRSTTPIHPSCLEEYCAEEPKTPDNLKGDKIKISLPKDLNDKHKNVPLRSKSPRRVSYGSSPKPWSEFAEKGVPNTPPRKSSMQNESEKQPELPPRAPVPKPQWINFEEVPERRKMPKRIQTIPRHSSEEAESGVVYNYVNPEDCKCECHESARASAEKEEDEEPLLDDGNEQDGLSLPIVGGLHLESSADRRSQISDSSLEYSCGHGHEAGDAQSNLQVGHPFNMDLGVHSNRSSVASQDSVPPHDVASPAQDVVSRP